jgi:hypothetical protein
MASSKSTRARKLKEVLKPLTRSEARRAVKATTDHLQSELVRADVSRFRVLGAELSITRSKEREAAPVRRIEVLIVDYLNRRHVRSVVEDGQVLETRTLEHQPAVSSEEIAEARELAATDDSIKRLARRKGVFVSHFAPGSHEPDTRRIGLYYLRTGRNGLAEILATAEVDLFEQRTLAVRLAGSDQAGTEGGTHGELR